MSPPKPTANTFVRRGVIPSFVSSASCKGIIYTTICDSSKLEVLSQSENRIESTSELAEDCWMNPGGRNRRYTTQAILNTRKIMSCGGGTITNMYDVARIWRTTKRRVERTNINSNDVFSSSSRQCGSFSLLHVASYFDRSKIHSVFTHEICHM